MARDIWPAIPFAQWRETCDTFHLYCQVIGKVRLALSPWVNHSWHATLYPTARGLTTSLIPHGSRVFEIEVDVPAAEVVIVTGDGGQQRFELAGGSLAAFHQELIGALGALELPVTIHDLPSEMPDPVPFHADVAKRPLDLEAVRRFHAALVQTHRVMTRFRTGFLGKVSPVHLFWGSFDLAVTRFSGRRAPPHPGGVPGLPDEVTREAYSHEVSSAGFWPGGGGVDDAAFYAYAYPAPDGFGEARVEPDGAYFHPTLKEFILPYDAVRTAADPEHALMRFLESTYQAAADLGRWDRAELDCAIGAPMVVRPHAGR